MTIATTKNKPVAHVKQGDTLVFKGVGYPVLKTAPHVELEFHQDITLGHDVAVPQPDGGFKMETQALQPLALHINSQVEVPA